MTPEEAAARAKAAVSRRRYGTRPTAQPEAAPEAPGGLLRASGGFPAIPEPPRPDLAPQAPPARQSMLSMRPGTQPLPSRGPSALQQGADVLKGLGPGIISGGARAVAGMARSVGGYKDLPIETPMEQAARNIEEAGLEARFGPGAAETPEGAARRQQAHYRAGQGVGQTVGGFGVAPFAIPIQGAAAIGRDIRGMLPPQLGGPSVPQEPRHVAEELVGLYQGMNPQAAYSAAIAQIEAQSDLTPHERAAAKEQFIREQGAGLVAAGAGILDLASGIVRGIRARRAKAMPKPGEQPPGGEPAGPRDIPGPAAPGDAAAVNEANRQVQQMQGEPGTFSAPELVDQWAAEHDRRVAEETARRLPSDGIFIILTDEGVITMGHQADAMIAERSGGRILKVFPEGASDLAANEEAARYMAGLRDAWGGAAGEAPAARAMTVDEAVALLRETTDRWYADEISKEEFDAAQRANWEAIEGQGEEFRDLVTGALRKTPPASDGGAQAQPRQGAQRIGQLGVDLYNAMQEEGVPLTQEGWRVRMKALLRREGIDHPELDSYLDDVWDWAGTTPEERARQRGYTPENQEIADKGISDDLLHQILTRAFGNADRNWDVYREELQARMGERYNRFPEELYKAAFDIQATGRYLPSIQDIIAGRGDRFLDVDLEAWLRERKQSGNPASAEELLDRYAEEEPRGFTVEAGEAAVDEARRMGLLRREGEMDVLGRMGEGIAGAGQEAIDSMRQDMTIDTPIGPVRKRPLSDAMTQILRLKTIGGQWPGSDEIRVVFDQFGLTHAERRYAEQLLNERMKQPDATGLSPAPPGQFKFRWAMKDAFNLTDDQAAATEAIVDAMGLDKSTIEPVKGGEPGGGALLQEGRDLTPLGFYDNILEALKTWQPRGTPDQVKAFLKKVPGATEEAKWIGLDDFLEGKVTVSREEVADFVRNNRVEVKEKILGGNLSRGEMEAAQRKVEEADAEFQHWRSRLMRAIRIAPEQVDEYFDRPNAMPPDELHDIERAIISTRGAKALADKAADAYNAKERALEGLAATRRTERGKYEDQPDLRLPGGENYREILLQLAPTPQKDLGFVLEPGMGSLPDGSTSQMILRFADKERPGQNVYAYISDTQHPLSGYAQHGRQTPKRYKADFQGDTTWHDSMEAAVEWGKKRMRPIMASLAERDPAGPQFTGSHFREKNVLAHVRVTDRKAPDGGKTLFIEELQSDWAQKGRKQGFEDPEARLRAAKRLRDIQNEITARLDNIERRWPEAGINPAVDTVNEIFAKLQMIINQVDTTTDRGRAWWLEQQTLGRLLTEQDQLEPIATRHTGVHAAPFVTRTTDWVRMALKRMIRYAVENGYDRIGWTTGEQQVQRYESALRKRVDRIEWEKTPEGVQIRGLKHTAFSQDPEMGRPFTPTEHERLVELRNQWEWRPETRDTIRDELAHLEDRDRYIRNFEPPREVVNTRVREDELSDAIGNAMADRIRQDVAQRGVIEGPDITVSDTGMAGFYDKILPQEMEKIAKKHGGKVERVPIEAGTKQPGPHGAMRPDQIVDGPREFAADDWNAFAGAEEFADGTQPVIAEAAIRIGNERVEVAVVADANGIEVVGAGATNDFMARREWRVIDQPNSAGQARRFVETMFDHGDAVDSLWDEFDIQSESEGQMVPGQADVHSIAITPEMKKAAEGGFPLFQKGGEGPKGSAEFAADGKAIIRGLKNPDVSTAIHEIAHVARRRLLDRSIDPEARRGITDSDIRTAEVWAGAKDGVWGEKAEEKFARGFEKYLRDGQAPSDSLKRIFEAFKVWLRDIYARLKGSEINVKISKEMREVFDRLVTRDQRAGAPETLPDAFRRIFNETGGSEDAFVGKMKEWLRSTNSIMSEKNLRAMHSEALRVGPEVKGVSLSEAGQAPDIGEIAAEAWTPGMTLEEFRQGLRERGVPEAALDSETTFKALSDQAAEIASRPAPGTLPATTGPTKLLPIEEATKYIKWAKEGSADSSEIGRIIVGAYLRQIYTDFDTWRAGFLNALGENADEFTRRTWNDSAQYLDALKKHRVEGGSGSFTAGMGFNPMDALRAARDLVRDLRGKRQEEANQKDAELYLIARRIYDRLKDDPDRKAVEGWDTDRAAAGVKAIWKRRAGKTLTPDEEGALTELEAIYARGHAEQPGPAQIPMGPVRRIFTKARTKLYGEFIPAGEADRYLQRAYRVQPLRPRLDKVLETQAGAAAMAEAAVHEFRRDVLVPLKAAKTMQEITAIAKGAYQKSMDHLLDMMVESGRMSAKLAAKIRETNDFYAPFRVMKHLEEREIAANTGRPIPGTAELTKAIVGIHHEDFGLADLFKSSEAQIVRAVILAQKNKKMLELSEMAKWDTRGDILRRLGPSDAKRRGYDVVTYLENGEPVQMEIVPEVARSLRGLSPGETNQAMKLALIVQAPLRFGTITANLGFQVANVITDQVSAMLIGKYGLGASNKPGLIRTPVAFVTDIVRWPIELVNAFYSSSTEAVGRPNKTVLKWMQSGAMSSTMSAWLREEMRLNPPKRGPLLRTRKATRGVLDSIGAISQALDQMTKGMMLGRGMRIEGIDKIIDPAMRERKMAEIITEIRRYGGTPDYMRQGEYIKGLSLLKAVFMFLPVRLQGAARDMSRLAFMPEAGGWKTALPAHLRLAGTIGAGTIYLYHLNHLPENEEDYKAVPDWEKMTYAMIPQYDDNGQPLYFVNEEGQRIREYFKIPVKETLRLYKNMVESIMTYMRDEDPEAFRSAMTRNLDDLSPVGVMGPEGQLSPFAWIKSTQPLIKVPAEMYMGKSTFTGRDIVPEGLQGIAPEEQFTSRTHKIYIQAAKPLSRLHRALFGGGGVSPMEIQHVVEGMMGTLPRSAVAPEPLPGRSEWSENIVGRRFWRSTQVNLQPLYDAYRPGERAYNTIRKFVKDGRIDEARAYAQEHEDELVAYHVLKPIKERISKIRKQSRAPGGLPSQGVPQYSDMVQRAREAIRRRKESRGQ